MRDEVYVFVTVVGDEICRGDFFEMGLVRGRFFCWIEFFCLSHLKNFS